MVGVLKPQSRFMQTISDHNVACGFGVCFPFRCKGPFRSIEVLVSVAWEGVSVDTWSDFASPCIPP
jgi:hypothetical protein